MAIDFKPMKAVNNHWRDLMPIMACEEMAELIQAISKFERYLCTCESLERLVNEDTEDSLYYRETYKQTIVKEMADVYIACAALTHRYGIMEAEIGEAIWKKMDKKY